MQNFQASKYSEILHKYTYNVDFEERVHQVKSLNFEIFFHEFQGLAGNDLTLTLSGFAYIFHHPIFIKEHE